MPYAWLDENSAFVQTQNPAESGIFDCRFFLHFDWRQRQRPCLPIENPMGATMWWIILKTAIAAVIIVAVSEVSQRLPRLGAILLTLPIVSVIAFVFLWQQYRDLPAVSRLARETLVLVPLGLPFFLPLAFAERLGLGFWPAFITGLALATVTIGLWIWLGPSA